jgi:hypothetical protein
MEESSQQGFSDRNQFQLTNGRAGFGLDAQEIAGSIPARKHIFFYEKIRNNHSHFFY